MSRSRRTAYGALIAGAACALLAIPTAAAQPDPTPEPTPEPTTEVAPDTTTDDTLDETTPAPAPAADCSAAGLSAEISSVTESLSEYFADNPETNQALIDFTRQPAFTAVGQFDGYFNDNPEIANEVRAIKQPLVDYQHQCGMQVTPAEALTVLTDL